MKCIHFSHELFRSPLWKFKSSDLEGMFLKFDFIFVMSEYSGRPVGICSGEFPHVNLGDVYLAYRWHTFCKDSFYWFKGANNLERQYC